MKRKLLCLAALYLPMMLFCQHGSTVAKDVSFRADSGIRWSQGLTWKQVKQKAKKGNKYIFVDCYATWCKPCKEMDKNVYTVDSVGGYLNAGFISVKVQMDQTKKDDAVVKSWYNTAREMINKYHVAAYPSYLFFAPNGEIVAKETGYKDPATFIQVARDATDPSKQYFVLLKRYKKGNLDDAAKRSLITTAKQLGDTTNYHTLRNSYFAYLHTLPKEKLYTKENIEFIASIISRRSQPVFDMFYPDGSSVDKVMEKNGYARKVIDDVIMKEKVAPFLNPALESKKEPDWKVLYNSIAKDYKGHYADRNVMEAKMTWYYNAEDAFKWARTLNDKIEKYGTDTTGCSGDGSLNNQADIIFKTLGTTSKPSAEIIAELNRVCGWMEGVVRRVETKKGWCHQDWPLYMDTYANLLYKVGRTAEAMKWQELAVRKGRELLAKDDGAMKTIEKNLDLMKKGEITWPVTDEKQR